ncbi:MAG: HAD-IC family P-type ATPase, partial [Methylobacterium sp.]|nr:HAD-IC family P-type ATPase [Methylobacterium sp.]
MSDPIHYQTLSTAQALQQLESHQQHGLRQATALRRLQHYGENRLAEAPVRPAWLKFLDQFRNLLVSILLVAATVAFTVGDIKDAVVILVVVLLNAALGFWQEHRAEATLAALKGMLASRARVRREGKLQEIDAAQLVPGDIVLLEAGDRIPADGRLLDAHNLEVDEAALTGESHPVGKHTRTLQTVDLPLGDLGNLLFMNTVVTRGRAELLVTATGMATQMGRLAGMIAAAGEPETPLQQQLGALGKRLAMIAGSVVAIIFALDFMRGLPWVQAMMTAVALAVAAIPEGLPAVVTVTLALGMHRMAKNRAIVKKLAAVETLGSTTVICSDKTGTLTLNQMTARAGWFAGLHYTASGEGYVIDGGQLHLGEGSPDPRPLLLPMVLCSESRVEAGTLIGDPTEGALHLLAQKGGLDPDLEQQRLPRIAEIPFDSAHKFMATFHHDGPQVRMFIKGAPDVLLERCSHWHGLTSPLPLDAAARATILEQQDHLADQALRVLA